MSDADAQKAAEAAIALFVELRKDGMINTFCTAAAFTLVMYDYVLTLEDEIQFIWKRNWGFSKILFIWTRYFGILLLGVGLGVILTPNHSKNFCNVYFYWEGFAGCIMLYSVELILQFRLYAMYQRSKKIAIFNGILFLAEILYMMITFGIGIGRGTTIATPPDTLGCYGTAVRYLFSIWFPALAFELNLVVQAVYKSYQNHKAARVQGANKNVNMLTLIVRDSVIYFIFIAFALFLNSILWAVAPAGLTIAGVPISHAAMFSGGSRLFLNVRRAYYTPVTQDGSWQDSKPSGQAHLVHINARHQVKRTADPLATGFGEETFELRSVGGPAYHSELDTYNKGI